MSLGKLQVADVLINEACNGLAADEVFFYDFGNVVSLNLAVKRAFGINDDDRTKCAQTKTTGHDDFDLVGNTKALCLGLKNIFELVGAGGVTTRTAADHDVMYTGARNACRLAKVDRILSGFPNLGKLFKSHTIKPFS